MTPSLRLRIALVAAVALFAASPDRGGHFAFAQVLGLSSSQTQPTTTPVALGTAVILGRVVDDSSGDPVAGSSVCMWLEKGNLTQFCEVTDEKGRFLYRRLPAGRYYLVAEPGNFARGEYGRTRPDGLGRRIDVTEGAQLMDVTIPVFKLGVVSGTVVDEAGEPVVRATVEAVVRRPSSRPTGTWNYASATSTVTDDRGRYRLGLNPDADCLILVQSAVFATVSPDVAPLEAPVAIRFGLPRRPGEASGPALAAGDLALRLSSGTRPAALPPPIDRNGVVYVYPTMFYPSVLTPDQATVVRVKAQEERRDLNVRLALERGARISGHVTSQAGSTANLTVRIRNQYMSMLAIADTDAALAMTDAGGGFTLNGVPAGEYVISVMQTGIAASSSTSAVPENPMYARQTMTVSSDINDMELALSAGHHASGTVTFDGTTQPSAAAIQKMATGLFRIGDANDSVGYAPIGSDGRFATPRYAPGKYVISGPLAPAGWFLRSIMWHGRDIAHRTVQLENEDLDGMVTTFTDRVTSVSGVVRGDRGPDGDALVVAFPTDYRSTPAYADVVPFLSIRASATGAFIFPNIWAREYFVAAIDESLSNTWTDFALLDRLATKATRVTLHEGDKLSQDLRRVTVR